MTEFGSILIVFTKSFRSTRQHRRTHFVVLSCQVLNLWMHYGFFLTSEGDKIEIEIPN